MTKPSLLSPDFLRDPYPFYKAMRDDYPLFYEEGMQAYVVSRFDDVTSTLSDPGISSSSYRQLLEPVYGRTLIQLDGKEHASHRNLIAPTFRARNLRDQFLTIIKSTACESLDTFRSRGEVELVAEFTTQFPVNVIVRILGLPPSDYRRFQKWTESLMAFLSNMTQDPRVAAAGLQTRQEYSEYMLPIIAQRRIQPQADLISLLGAAQMNGESLTDEDILGFSISLLVGGGESTDKTLASLFKNLLDHPEQLEKVSRDRALLDRALAETLRYSPTGHIVMRIATQELKLSAGTIPAGSLVACLIGAANRDERRFARPDSFDMLRPDLDIERAFTGGANHLTFGHGRHFCIGSGLAKMELQVAGNLLLEAMKDLRYADPTSPPEVGFFVRSPRLLRLCFTPATSTSSN